MISKKGPVLHEIVITKILGKLQLSCHQFRRLQQFNIKMDRFSDFNPRKLSTLPCNCFTNSIICGNICRLIFLCPRVMSDSRVAMKTYYSSLDRAVAWLKLPAISTVTCRKINKQDYLVYSRWLEQPCFSFRNKIYIYIPSKECTIKNRRYDLHGIYLYTHIWNKGKEGLCKG